MLKPARSLWSSPSSASGAMPYNWNWQRRWTEVDDFLRANQIILMDVGARGAAPPEFESMLDYVLRVGFEGDPEECARLNATNAGKFFPDLVAGEPGPVTLNIYKDPAQSSVLTMNERYRGWWQGDMPILKTFTSDATTLDLFMTDHKELAPDFLKLDTQGTELYILQGATETLRNLGLVEVEVEFLELYDKQPLFADVLGLMMDQGYELLYLSRVLASRKEIYSGPSRGQMLFGDALFGKREDHLDGFTPEQLVKHCILLCQFGHMDIAWQLMQAHPVISQLAPGLSSVFSKRSSTVVRGALMQLDKLLAFGLHARRYNQRGMDTDRAWPIR